MDDKYVLDVIVVFQRAGLNYKEWLVMRVRGRMKDHIISVAPMVAFGGHDRTVVDFTE